MTTLTFKQTGAVGEYLQAGCSSLDLPDPNVTNHLASVGGSGSAVEHTRTITGSDTGDDSEVMLAGWIAYPAGVQGGDTWEAGDWICRLQVTAANSAVQWTSVYICGKVGSDWTTIASKTDVNTLLASTGTKTTTLTTGSATDWSGAASSPYLYWFYGFEKSVSADQTFKFKSNKNLASPIVAKVNMSPVTLVSAPVVPSVTHSAAPVGVPVASFAGSGVAPTDTHIIAAPVASFASSALAPVQAPVSTSIAAPVASLASSLALPSVSAGDISVAAPVASFAGSAVVPSMTLIMEVPVSTMVLSQTYAQEFVFHDTIDRSWRGHFMSGTPEAAALTAGCADRGYAMSGDMEAHYSTAGSQQASNVNAALMAEDYMPSSKHDRAYMPSSSAEGVNVSVAIEARHALACGGPEASFPGQG